MWVFFLQVKLQEFQNSGFKPIEKKRQIKPHVYASDVESNPMNDDTRLTDINNSLQMNNTLLRAELVSLNFIQEIITVLRDCEIEIKAFHEFLHNAV